MFVVLFFLEAVPMALHDGMIANCVVKTSVPAIILFCVFREDVDDINMYINGRRFGPVAFIRV